METGQTRQPILGITAPQICSGALASVTAAIIASYFGIAGTLIGAAITSVVATVGGAFYRSSLERAQARILIRRDPKTGETTKEIVVPAELRRKRRVHWVPIGAAIVLVFALAIGAVTVVEVAAQRPLASLFGRTAPDSGQTSLGVAVREVSNPVPAEEPAEEPTAAPGLAPSPTGEGAPGVTPSVVATTAPSSAPTGVATTVPVAPASRPSSAPSSAPSAAPSGRPSSAPLAPSTAPNRPGATPVAP